MLATITRRPAIAGLWLLLLLLLAAGLVELDLPTLWNRLVLYGIGMQRDLHRDLAASMRAMQGADGAAFWSLVGLGFLYGVFHAIGPGHGKVVISTYLATHESRLGRGIALSLLSSLVQGLTAILLVGGVALVADRSLRDSQQLGIWLEVFSYGLVILIGFFLTLRGARRLMTAHRQEAHEHDHAACCHGHGPSAAQLETPMAPRELVAMILSIGIRPCSGAILVLVLAFALQQLPAGIAAVLAMSLGTGLSISALAALSVYARKGALALAGAFETGGQGIARLADVAAILGGLVIVAFGLALLSAGLSVSSHPLL
ncbi:MAG: nickel/cobalt transporter [Alphaproteobacteria bacterium]